MRKKTAREARESSLASGWIVEGDPASAAEPGPASDPTPAAEPAPGGPSADSGGDDERRPEQLSNLALVLLGVFGGLYLFYAWGWFAVAQVYSSINEVAAQQSGVVGSLLQNAVYWSAPAAPLLWFGSALLLGRGGHTRRLAVSLIVGAVVLVPLPMLVQGAGA